MAFELQFLGGTQTVTGSKYLLRSQGKNILIDCGLFQGLKTLRQKNWEPFPIPPSEIDAILLTHAHIDHSGYIPRLIKNGFKGKIYSTSATKDLCAILLPDSGYLMEEEAEYLNKKKRSSHSPALPLFTRDEAEKSLPQFESIPFDQERTIFSNLSFRFQYAGHIFGAASIVLKVGDRKIAFTGDIGRLKDRVLYPPKSLPKIDYLVIESTYGNRLHRESDIAEDLASIINETYQKRGVIIVPAFAVGRAQVLMYYLSQLKSQKKIPDIPMYLNSPMATNVSDLLCKYMELHRLSENECQNTCGVVDYVKSVEASKELNERKGPMLIVSASGMLTGGRVLHHLKAFAPYPENTILLSGYQAAGTRGEALEHGAQEIKIHGEYIQVKAQVRSLPNMSAHADYGEILEWLSGSDIHPKKTFITHGEPAASDELRRRLGEAFKWNCFVPDGGSSVRLE